LARFPNAAAAWCGDWGFLWFVELSWGYPEEVYGSQSGLSCR
jgi:hypothetical protein